MGISSLRKLLWVSTSSLQKCSFKLLLKQLSRHHCCPLSIQDLCLLQISHTPSLISLTSQITHLSLKLQFGLPLCPSFYSSIQWSILPAPFTPCGHFPRGSSHSIPFPHCLFLSFSWPHSLRWSLLKQGPTTLKYSSFAHLYPAFSWLTDTAILNITIELHIYPT